MPTPRSPSRAASVEQVRGRDPWTLATEPPVAVDELGVVNAAGTYRRSMDVTLDASNLARVTVRVTFPRQTMPVEVITLISSRAPMTRRVLRSEEGFTLVEVMIAVVIGTIVLIAATGLALVTGRSLVGTRLRDGVTRNARYACVVSPARPWKKPGLEWNRRPTSERSGSGTTR